MIVSSIGLAILAILLAWPVPIVLSRAAWPARAPASALLLWQAIALAGGFAMIGSLAFAGLASFGDEPFSALWNVLPVITGETAAPEFGLWSALALCLAAVLTVHLLLTLVLTVVASERQRRQHAQLITLLSAPMDSDPRTRMLDSTTPMAYCLPGAVRSITVFSAGLVALLDADELTAVIEHERAHLSQRHDVVLIMFRAWHAALPWFPIASRAQNEVGVLIEMLADDRARRFVSDGVLARAIVLVGARGDALPPAIEAIPDQASPVEDRQELSARVRRLARPAASLRLESTVVVGSIALLVLTGLLLAAPTVIALLA